MSFQFPPLADKKRFPLLSAMSEMPSSFLMACDSLVFTGPVSTASITRIVRQPSVGWHEYGDARWPSQSQWVEFPLRATSGSLACGAMIVRQEIPADVCSPLQWAAQNHPLLYIHPGMAAPDAAEKMSGLFGLEALSKEQVPGPSPATPAFVHGYCLFAESSGSECTLLATYTDILNSEGVPIPQFRIADVTPTKAPLCRAILHALFRLNEARIQGMEFVTHTQCQSFDPVFLDEDQPPPKWAAFHPSRTLRSRPSLRDLDPPPLTDGIMAIEDYSEVTELRRHEWNTHMLAFERRVRPRDMVNHGTDSNATMAAYLNRVQGGAIYVLPDMLVEEFDHTDCSEVRLSDISLPFFNLYLKFRSPQKLFLTEKAFVDGCYLVRHPGEYLLTLTSCVEGTDYQNSLSVCTLDPIFSLHLPTADADITLNTAVEMGINAFLSENAPPDDNISQVIQRPDGALTQVIDVRSESRKKRIATFRSQEPTFRACLNIIVNAACFISFRPTDIEESWEGRPAEEILTAANLSTDSRRNRDRKTGALQKIANGDYTRIKICGRNLFSEPRDHRFDGLGKSPRTHWRRGHWRRQKHGAGLTLVVIRWIRPTLVKPDNGPLVETRIYDVEGASL